MIKLEQATKQFPSKNGPPVVALRDVDLEVQSGEFLMIVGPSGSGKSTLLFTIGGMQKPTAGRVFLEDTDIYSLSSSGRAALRRTQIGFMFQTFNLVPYLNCVDNVIVPAVLAGRPRGASIRRAGELLDGLGLGERLRHRPSELSVGERQRVALCRSLINNPKVILADEPTGNLDGGITEEVMQLLGDLNAKGQTIVMATHNLGIAEQGTRLLALRDGCVEEDRPSCLSGAA